jgi:BolA protein
MLSNNGESNFMTGHYALLRMAGSRVRTALIGFHPSSKRSDMRTLDTIERKLAATFAPQSLRVVDESHLHDPTHPGHRPEGQTHYRVYIVADAFKGKSRIDRHRMINAALATELAGGVHALAIHASAPGE